MGEKHGAALEAIKMLTAAQRSCSIWRRPNALRTTNVNRAKKYKHWNGERTHWLNECIQRMQKVHFWMVAIHHEPITHELTRKNRLHCCGRLADESPAEWRYHLADECSVWYCPKPNTFLDSFTFNDWTIKINLFAQPRIRTVSMFQFFFPPCSTFDIFFSFFPVEHRARLSISHRKYFTSTFTKKARDLPKPWIWVNFIFLLNSFARVYLHFLICDCDCAFAVMAKRDSELAIAHTAATGCSTEFSPTNSHSNRAISHTAGHTIAPHEFQLRARVKVMQFVCVAVNWSIAIAAHCLT